MRLQDFKLTEIIKFKKYFEGLQSSILTEYSSIDFEMSKIDKERVALIQENIDFIDSYIVREFQFIKFDTELPDWYSSKEELSKKLDEMAKFNSQMQG